MKYSFSDSQSDNGLAMIWLVFARRRWDRIVRHFRAQVTICADRQNMLCMGLVRIYKHRWITPEESKGVLHLYFTSFFHQNT
jgi:hypothetical protein